MVEIIENGDLEHYEFYCSLCGTRFRARVDDCDSLSYILGIPFVNLRCPHCKINNCSRRADDFIHNRLKGVQTMAEKNCENCANEFCAFIPPDGKTYCDRWRSNAPAVNRWIPCSEQMPEKHTEVLAYSPFWGKIVVAMWGGEFWLEQWTDDDLEQSEITHWMPLPEPPEGGADDAT